MAIGIKKELELAIQLGLTHKNEAERVIKLCENNFELDMNFPKHLDLNAISTFLTKDKKNMSSKIHWVSIEKVGKARLDTFGSSIDQIQKCLAIDYLLKVPKDHYICEETVVIDHQGSKSISNRALIIAALLNKPIILHNISPGKDTIIMINALRKLGIKVKPYNKVGIRIEGDSVSISSYFIL